MVLCLGSHWPSDTSWFLYKTRPAGLPVRRVRNVLPSPLRCQCFAISNVPFCQGEGDPGRRDRAERPCGAGVVPEPES